MTVALIVTLNAIELCLAVNASAGGTTFLDVEVRNSTDRCSLNQSLHQRRLPVLETSES